MVLSSKQDFVAKRLFDIAISSFFLIALMPLLAVLFLISGLFIGSPALFSQLRVGRNGQTFVLHKFRTMIEKSDSEGQPLSDEDRLTKLGQLLRQTSLDELPELWNVLRGDMSLVGPRPLLPEYLPLYTREQARRHEIRPGITGWAQVNGRNALEWEHRFKLDVWYVDNVSFLLDIKILFLTVKKVFTREGINQEGNATMRKFTGTRP